MREKKFTGYVLAGGKSSRMGSDKAFLKVGGKTFLENAVDALRPHCSLITIVFNDSQKLKINSIPAKIPHIFDIFENRGAPGGIHAALHNCKTEFAVILAVDLPFVTGQAIDKMCETAVNVKDFSAVVPRQSDGKLQPLCAVYRVKDCLTKIEKVIKNDDSASVRDFLKLLPVKYIEQHELTRNYNKNLFMNINSPLEFQKIKIESLP